MKYLILFFLSIFGCQKINAQLLYAEILAGHQKAQHEILISKPIDSLGKFSFFNFTQFTVEYNNRKIVNSFIYTVAILNLNKNIGISSGGYMTNLGFVPIAAILFQGFNKKGDLHNSVFTTIDLTKNPNYEIFGLLIYNPIITPKFNFFLQHTFSINFNFNQHNFSFQQIRIGLDYQSLQFGLGCDTQIPTIKNPIDNKLTTELNPNIGLFLRKNFD